MVRGVAHAEAEVFHAVEGVNDGAAVPLAGDQTEVAQQPELMGAPKRVDTVYNVW